MSGAPFNRPTRAFYIFLLPTATPPRLHLEPTYTPHAAAAKGRATGLASAASRGGGAVGGQNLPPFRLNHHNLAKVSYERT